MPCDVTSNGGIGIEFVEEVKCVIICARGKRRFDNSDMGGGGGKSRCGCCCS